ncbi:MAG: hypothetical protein IPI30_21755 [Saprospiraceae bacterium]|nr:hypothetical protein [Candidatus Vicinibacter affinis]
MDQIFPGEAKASPSDPSCGTPILSYRDSLLNIYSACPNAKNLSEFGRPPIQMTLNYPASVVN